MATLTERVSATLPAEQKARIMATARERGISMGEMMRRIIDDQIAVDQFKEWFEIYAQLRAVRR